MIVQGIVGAAASFLAWIGTLFPPAPDLADTLSQTHGMWASLMTSFVGLGVWVDWVWLLGVIGLVVGVYLVMFVVKLVRAIASYVPFFGGAG